MFFRLRLRLRTVMFRDTDTGMLAVVRENRGVLYAGLLLGLVDFRALVLRCIVVALRNHYSTLTYQGLFVRNIHKLGEYQRMYLVFCK